jgi:PST family polysaccharide transporter
MTGFKQKAIRGGLAKVFAQGTTFSLRLGSLMVLARLLDPKDFGLVGMVTAFTGVLNLFRDFGLSAAAVQRVKVTEEQVSTLFWINLLVGAVLTLLMVAMAPAIAAFYHEPRLFWVTIVLASGFLVNAAGVQHSSLLQRQMRFTTMAGIDVVALVVSITMGIGMALRGYGYWSLVATAIVPTMVTTACLWTASAWVPGRPRRGTDMRSMLRFGGTLTLNGVVVYLAYNLDKVLLGRFWGAQAVGLYGRAYALINMPTENLNTAAGEVAFPALSRVQDDPVRLKRYFLKGYSLVLALTVPITIAAALFASDLISVVLGAKWHEAIVIFRLLAPSIIILALLNPLIWLLLSLGMVGRSLRVGLVYSPIVIAGCIAGLHYGPAGVALGYSTVLTIWCIPHIAWCVRGTVVPLRDILHAAGRPLLSGLTAAAVAAGLQSLYGNHFGALSRLVLGTVVLLGVYLVMLLYVMGQRTFYLDLIRGLTGPSLDEEAVKTHSPLTTQETGDASSLDRESATLDNVLFVASDYKPKLGGIASYLDSLARGLIGHGKKIKVLALVDASETDRLDFLNTYEKWVISLPIAHDGRPRNWLANKCMSLLEIMRCKSPRIRKLLERTSIFKASSESIAQFKRVIEEEKPALIVLGHLDLQLYPLILHLQETGQPYGIIAHDSEIYFFRNRVNDRIRRGMIIKGAKWIAANSRHTRSLVEAWGIARENIMIIHPPLSERAISISDDFQDTARDDVFTLVTVSRIVQNKAIDVVLRALHIMDRQHIPFRYLVVGDGPERAPLERLTAELGLQDHINFTGCVSDEDKWHVLQSADLFVMPSRVNPEEQHEGFGIAFLEAAACGIPSVGTNAGGIPDAVVDGETGMLVEPDSPEALAQALIFLYQNPERRKQLGQAARARARTHFSPSIVAAQFHQEVSLRI